MATYKYYAFTYTTPNDEHEGQYGVDIVAQQIQYGEYGVMSNTGPAIHAWYGQMQDSGSSWSPKKQQLSSNVKDGAWLVGGLRYMTTAVFLATPRVLSGQVPSRGPEIQPPGRSSTTRHHPPPRSVSVHRPQPVKLVWACQAVRLVVSVGCGSSSNRTQTRAALHDCRRGVADCHPAAGNRRPRPEIPYGAELTAVVEQLRPNRRADPTAGGNHAQPGAGRSPAGAPGCVSPLVRCGDDMDKLVVPLR